MDKITKEPVEEFTSYFTESESIFETTEEGDLDCVVDIKTLGGHYVKIEHGFKCSIDGCKQILSRKKDYDLHVFQHTGEKTVECLFEGCSNKYATRSSMIRHLKKIHPKDDRVAQVVAKTLIERKYKCDYDGCDQEFLRKSGLDSHMFEHTGLKTLDCPIDGCDKLYVTMQSLQRHLKTIHLKSELICKAPNCKQQYETTEEMQEHYNKSHLNEKNHICTECSEGFRRKMDLKKHMYKHTNEYPFKCADCDKGFTQSQKLTKHMETHTGKKCQHCQQLFKNWTELVRHQKNEHSSDPKCEECGKMFKTRANLRRHLKLHIMRPGERKNFECSFENCTRSYTQYNNLQTHIKSAHQGIFKCTVDGCNKSLSSKRRLLHHVKMHEQPKPKPQAPRKKPSFTKPKKVSNRISTASKLVNIENPFEIEKEIILGNGENVKIDDDMSLSDAVLDASDFEEYQNKTLQMDSTAMEFVNCVPAIIRKDYNSDSSSSTIIPVC